MKSFDKSYLDEVVETQGKLFLDFAENFPDADTKDLIEKYLKSETRKFIDEGRAYSLTRDHDELLDAFLKEGYKPKKGKNLTGFLPDWIGEFYACYQWKTGMSSRKILEKLPVNRVASAYRGLHDLDLDLAVEKVLHNSD